MGRDKSKVAWGKGNSRGDLCSTTSSTTAVQDLLRRDDERRHQGPLKLAANVLLRERTEGHSRAYRSSQRMVKTCRRVSQESILESSDPKSDALSIAPLALQGRGGTGRQSACFPTQGHKSLPGLTPTIQPCAKDAVTRIRTGVAAATTQSTNHYTITANHGIGAPQEAVKILSQSVCSVTWY